MTDKKEIKMIIENIIEETTNYDFPFFSSMEKRLSIMKEKKASIDQRLDRIIEINNLRVSSEYDSDKIWEDAQKEAVEKFEGLSEKLILNGFYLQEVCHIYAEKKTSFLLDALEK